MLEKIKATMLQKKQKIFLLEFEQRRILANVAAAFAVASLINLLLSGRGLLSVAAGGIAAYVLIYVAVALVKKQPGDEK